MSLLSHPTARAALPPKRTGTREPANPIRDTRTVPEQTSSKPPPQTNQHLKHPDHDQGPDRHLSVERRSAMKARTLTINQILLWW